MALVNTKLNDTYLSLFVLGIMCNVFVVFGVEEYKTNTQDIGKYLGIIFAVMVFILAGFEHSIADIFYFAMAGVWSLDGFLRILVIVLGNAVGGLLVPSVRLLERE